MGESDELRTEIRDLARQVERLQSILEQLTQPYRETLSLLGRFEDIGRAYLRILSPSERYGELSAALVVPEVKDTISMT